MDNLGEAEHALVVGDPLVEPPQLDVADNVVDAREQPRVAAFGDRVEAGEEGALIAIALDERVQGLAVGGDRRHPDRAGVIRRLPRLAPAARAAAPADPR